jgi:HK97 family phage major capsid protein
MDNDMLLTFGGEVKSLGDGRIGGYLVRFSDPEHHDLEGEYFDAATDYDIDDGTKTSVYLNHRRPLTTKDGKRVAVREKIGEGTLRLDSDGVLIDAILYNAERYQEVLYKLGWSSGTAPHLVEFDEPLPNGVRHIARWPLGLDASITPIPANPWGSRVVPFKSLFAVGDDRAEEPEPEGEAEDAVSVAAPVKAVSTDVIETSTTEEETDMAENEAVTMTPDELKALVSQAVDDGVKAWESRLPKDTGGYVVEDELDKKAKDPEVPAYKHLGEQLLDVMRACKPGAKPSERLLKSQKAIVGASEQVPADGGFLVQTDLAGELMRPVYETSPLLSGMRRFTISGNANSVLLYGVDETSRATGSRYGGVRAYRLAEGDALTASKPKFKQIRMELHKVGVLAYATDEILQDSTLLGQVIGEAARNELAFFQADDVLRGTGVGMPLGILNAPALVTVVKETGQAADTVLAENILKMWVRMPPQHRARAAWFINQEVEPQLQQMSLGVGTGGMLVYMPPGGLSGAPYGSLQGRPVIPAEHMSQLGDVGDIGLFDMSQYYWAEKGGIQEASSMHVEFLTAQMVFRFIVRYDGQPSWSSALTPYKGTTTTGTLSPFVVLAARA